MLYYLRSDVRLSVLFRTPGPILGLRSDNRAPFPTTYWKRSQRTKVYTRSSRLAAVCWDIPTVFPPDPEFISQYVKVWVMA